ncbi:MAG: hypothetical protein J6T57_01505 [Alphaproteobacteria bacterium]|nr:hypothetical protein [Alphaproteobacteria bacterium]
MTNKLQRLIQSQSNQNYAVANGRDIHKKLQNLFFDAHNAPNCNVEIAEKIAHIPELVKLMGPKSKTEVPIAGFVHGKFISRRIDRLYIDDDTKTIVVLDYKTDTDKKLFYKKYSEQLNEYYELLKQIYSDFTIKCKILWLCDFTLENII